MEDLEVPGTLYITQNRIYFHSFVFGCATQIVIFFSEISGISASQRIYASLVNVETNQGGLAFRVDPVLEEELVESLQLIWQNRQQDKPESPEEIVKKLNAMKEKFLSKTAEGSNKAGKPVMDEAVTQRLLERDNYNLPADIPAPTTLVVCECASHLENKTIETAFPLPAKMLFELLFGSESQGYWKKVDQERGTHDRQELEWSTDAAPVRAVKCMVAVNNPMGMFFIHSRWQGVTF
jgi:hypothetical protein